MSWLSSLKSVFSPSQEVKEEEIQQVLQNYVLPNSNNALKDRITQVNVQGQILQITINTFPSEADDLQKIHDDLADALEKCRINELNMHVIQQKTGHKSEGGCGHHHAEGESCSSQEKAESSAAKSQLPPVVDASAKTPEAPAEVDPNNPPIQKAAPQQRDVPKHPRIKNVILVSSGKGGVGKSTTTVNLALALQQLGLKVGVLDADIYGPSIPTMLGNAGRTPMIEAEQFVPIEAYGMAVLSIGHLTGDNNTPVAWRGPKATGALMQLFNQTLWPDLDVLIIDMPPGTGDIQLTLAQRIPVTGAVIVTTPQNVALMDATKGIELFNRVHIPVMGVVENMSTHICSNCGHEEQIFGTGGGDQLSAQYDIPLLGRLPLNVQIRENADAGKPSVIAGDDAAESYVAIAQKIADALPQAEKDKNRIF
ncbi:MULTISPECIES: iron-sulfur cluster carrier protein ApbC [Acinetobacter]|uniref:iron-sulfur cluster carrier protein ApbC n=1 Tax=Acinetobacter TaxID=469 RepID=UPI0009927549|nr:MULTISPECIES: iron-sulfur cluster carrier protein ApbC [Acinetobacter]MCL6244863.1 iron-sulfur cluster carrier protein ApbC [Acinetobacter amyesii]OOV84203.1 ATP-binding protein [Acinetobacter sp. ANC 5600]